LEVDLRTEAGQQVATTTTGRAGGFGFADVTPGTWEVKVSGLRTGDFESAVRTILVDGETMTIPRVDIYGYGAAALEPGDGATLKAPNPTRPVVFRWVLPDIAGAAARVRLHDSAGNAVWFSQSFQGDSLPWNGLGNQGRYQGTLAPPGSYTWRVKFELPDSSEARVATRRLVLT